MIRGLLKRNDRSSRFWLGLGLLVFGLQGMVLAQCVPQTAGVIMSTPMSSRLNWKGDQVQAVLEHSMALGPNLLFPAGTMLFGQVTAVDRRQLPGKLKFEMTQAQVQSLGVVPIQAVPATEDGWLQLKDADTPVWHISLRRSTRLLNAMVRRRLPANPGVWASSLGINRNVIPDVTTDEFIAQYHRQDVLVGAGDRIYLRFSCP